MHINFPSCAFFCSVIAVLLQLFFNVLSGYFNLCFTQWLNWLNFVTQLIFKRSLRSQLLDNFVNTS